MILVGKNVWKLLIILFTLNAIISSISVPRRLDGFLISNSLLDIGELRLLVPALTLLFLLLLVLNNILKFHLKSENITFFVTVLIFSLCPFISTVAGIGSSFDLRIILLPLAVILIFKYPTPTQFELSKFIIALTVFYLCMTLLFLVLFSNWSLQKNYTIGWFSFINSRLYGASGHPNNLASLFLFGLIYVVAFPQLIKSKILKWLFIGTALILIFWTQSKTALATVLVSVLTFYYFRYIFSTNSNNKKFSVFLSVVFLTCAALFLLLNLQNLYELTYSMLGESKMNRLVTLTGRDVIWKVVLDTIQQNYIFGFGPTFFDESKYFLTTLGFTPGHAHNQFFQTLGETGFLGLFFLVMYLLRMFNLCFKSIDNKALLITVVLFFLIRSFTQSVFRSGFDEIFIMHCLLLIQLKIILQGKEVQV